MAGDPPAEGMLLEEIETGGWFAPEIVDDWIKRNEADFAPGFVKIWRRWRGKTV